MSENGKHETSKGEKGAKGAKGEEKRRGSTSGTPKKGQKEGNGDENKSPVGKEPEVKSNKNDGAKKDGKRR